MSRFLEVFIFVLVMALYIWFIFFYDPNDRNDKNTKRETKDGNGKG